MSPYIEFPQDKGATLSGYIEFPPFPNRAPGPSGPWAIGSVQLDGINDYVDWTASNAWNFQYTDPFTVCARVYSTSNDHNAFIYTRQDTTNLVGVQYYLAKGAGAMNPGMQLLSGGGGANQLRTDATTNGVSLNTWYSIFWVNDGGGTGAAVKVHIGATTPAQTDGSGGTMSSIQNNQPAYVGIFPDGFILQFTGYLRCFGVYSKAATLAERTNWDTVCAALEDPTNQIGNCVSFISFNTNANDSVGSENGTLRNGAAITSFVG